MSQKTGKLWSLSALATQLLFRQSLRKACIIQEQFQAKSNVWRTTTKTFLRSSSCFSSVSGMLQHESENRKTMEPFRASDTIVI